MKELKLQSKYFLKNPWYVGMLVSSAILGYGYVLTHGTCGIDDISIDLYFENGIGVAIGRWPYYLINKIIPIAEYTPFIGDFVTVLLLMISAVMWCVLLRSLIKEEVPMWAYVAFSAFFLDYSMNADVFVFYLQNGLGWVFLLSIFSIIAFLHLYRNEKRWASQIAIRMSIIIMLTVAISFYESAANVFVTGALLVMFINLYVEKKDSVFRGKSFVTALIFIARYMVYAMVGRRVVRTFIMRIFGIPAYTFYRSTSSLEWLTKGGINGTIKAIKKLFAQIYRDYFVMSVTHYPVLLFVLCSIIFILVIVYATKKNRDMLLALTGFGVYTSMFVLSVVQGSTMAYRACQIFTVFIAFVIFVSVIIIMKQKTILKRIGICVIVILFGISVYDMTKWFSLDYEKTAYEMSVIDNIAEELNSGKYNVQEKPLVVVGVFNLPEELYENYCIKKGDFGWDAVKKAAEQTDLKVDDYYCYGQNSTSILDWSVHAFAMSCGYNVPIRQFFEYRGYEFQWAGADVVDRVFKEYFPMDWEYYSYSNTTVYTEMYTEIEQYPYEGYIEELEDCIVIKL